MARKTKAQRAAERAADRFRERVREVLQDTAWLDEDVRRWLREELERDPEYIFSDKEHAALARIVAAGTIFEGWDGRTVQQLAVAASRYMADFAYEDELFLKDLLASGATRLRLREMKRLAELAGDAGEILESFRPVVTRYGKAA